MKTPLSLKKSVFSLMWLCVVSISAYAQKPDNVQSGNVWVSAPVKIDGKLNEWGDPLKAYNKTIRVWYTLANDDKNLYLVIRSVDEDNITKILAGGISLAINTDGKKKEKNAFILTYPVINRAATRGGGRGRRGGGGQQPDAPDSAAVVAQQKQLLATSKEISAIGFKEITDTLISVYNEYGIKAAANIDEKADFVYELSVPLNMLGLSATLPKEIAYDIKINGLQLGDGFKNIRMGSGGGLSIDGGGGGGRGGGGGFGGGGSAFSGGSAFGGGKSSGTNTEDMASPTDFWGKYTLATGSR